MNALPFACSFDPASLGYVAPVKVSAGIITRIQQATADHFGVAMLDMVSARRGRCIARPRQVAMYLARHMTGKSLPDIGRRFGGRDHTTVIHAVRQIEKLRVEDDKLDHAIETIAAALVSDAAEKTVDRETPEIPGDFVSGSRAHPQVIHGCATYVPLGDSALVGA